ncbi:hypothetical protein [Helicobacter sp. MIT 14-3879]|uniref:hypothetical protein n=1 Tax=Helicobacter sp. MIT 14-3879 TaxID=2040649 RepID=UPI000E1EBB8F|nr:hypothetical protein [Helicobacter sp. MIT 14-3879]RDU64682.1 hypothetical protein CQA44_02925 [Helicobacter sp. MIT 14-3879]
MIFRLLGGLGNQMFIYAFAKALHKEGCDIVIDGSLYNYNTTRNILLDNEKLKLYNINEKMGGGIKSVRKCEIENFNISLKISKNLLLI